MTIFTLHSEPLKEEWQDAYGHLAHIMKVDGTERASYECLLLHYKR